MDKALKPRINKFIFKNENFYFRMLSHAKNLKVKKFEDNYLMEFESIITKSNPKTSKFVSVDVNLIKDSKSVSIENELIQESWGQRICIKNQEEDSVTYYLLPNKRKFAIQIGPISNLVNGIMLELDWGNIQWVGI